MKISAQEEYGLRCLLRVARSSAESVTLPEIATAEGLSVPYVAKLMSVMRHAGLVDSVRGRSGGYKLARPADEIGLGSLLLTLGEPLFEENEYCQKHAGIAPNGICANHAGCSLKSLWQTLEAWLRGTLDRITLADLIRHEGRVGTLLRERLVAGDGPQQLIPLTMLSE
jgi:Rrf2 family protein